MNDLIPEGGYTPTTILAKQGVTAIGSILGGAGLLVLGALGARFPVIGLAAGAVLGIVGITGLLSKDPDDRKPALIVTGAGILSVLSRVPVARAFAGTLFGIGALGLLAIGIWNGVKFIKGLKSRS
ncbi:MAG: hypothetical protein LBT16_10020 [Treponema sp.]|jgi:hypothetical protein|nr:hypothetical protein [Treponema sp.]